MVYNLQSFTMKVYVFFAFCFIAGSALALTPTKKISRLPETTEEEGQRITQCLKSYDLSEELANLDNIPRALQDLTDLQKGCYKACIWRGYGWMKSDGTIDFDDIFEGAEKFFSGQLTRHTYEVGSEGCRAAAGKDDCRFFNCYDKLKVQMPYIQA